MKYKNRCILVFVVLNSLILRAQGIDSNKVPAVVTAKFLQVFPTAHNVHWSIGGGDGIVMYDVNISDDTSKYFSVVLDTVGTVQEVDINEREFHDTIYTYENKVMLKASKFMYRRYTGCTYSSELEYGTGYKFEHCIIHARDKKGREAQAFFNAKGKVERPQRLRYPIFVE